MNGFWERVAIAFRCFFSILFHGDIPNDIVQKLVNACRPGSAGASSCKLRSLVRRRVERPASEAFDRAVQMLALLQRDGRLIDFLAENISTYPDAQLGAAVRTIHEACRKVLEHYVKLEPILNSEEDQPVTVQGGFRSGSHQIDRQRDRSAADSRCVTTQRLAREGGESAAVAAGCRPDGDCAG